MWRNTQLANPLCTQDSSRASIYAGMSAYGFINVQPPTEAMGTICSTDSLLTAHVSNLPTSSYLSSSPVFYPSASGWPSVFHGFFYEPRSRILSDINDRPRCTRSLVASREFNYLMNQKISLQRPREPFNHRKRSRSAASGAEKRAYNLIT